VANLRYGPAVHRPIHLLQSIVRAYLQVCLSIYQQAFPVHITYGRGSVLLWRRSDTFYTSGSVDDVMFSRRGVSRDTVAATPLQRRVQANSPAAWY